MPSWTQEDDERAAVVRIFHDAVALPGARCPTHRRTTADRAVLRPGPVKPTPLCEAPLDALEAALDLVEHRGWSVESATAHLPVPGESTRDVLGTPVAPLHEGLLTWVRHATEVWTRSLAETDGPHPTPCPDPWVCRYPAARGARRARTYEVLTRGRRYTCFDGPDRVRELWVPIPGPLTKRSSSVAADAVAAHVLATGVPVDRTALETRPWRYRGGTPLPVRRRTDASFTDEAPPDRVRVVHVSCLDGARATRFDGTVDEAVAFYAAEGRPTLRAMVGATKRTPGPDCGTCKLHRGCDRLVSAPGLLGFRDRTRPRRTWSVGAGVRAASCPAAEHLRSLGLPGTAPDPATSRERSVRAQLVRRHARTPRRPCSPDTPPDGPAPKLAEGETDTVAALLAAHARHCPLRTLPARAPLYAGLLLNAEDVRTDVLVLARPDLLYRDGDSWVQRRTVTARHVPEEEGPALVAARPHLALAVLFFAFGVVPLGEASRVELETLTPDGAHVHTVDPFSPAVRAESRSLISELTSLWHRDTVHPPTPGRVCASCSHRRWCPAAPPERKET